MEIIMKTLCLIIVLITGFCITPGFALQTGEKAVKIKIGSWLKNGPVEFKFGEKVPENQKNDLYVLVLWGTWSPACRQSVPMLVHLQNKYSSKGMHIIAVSRESRNTVEKFLEEFPQINYAVATDDQSLTTLSFLGESRLLPRIYIINTENKIIWDGEIADLSMTLEDIYKGSYNADTHKLISGLQQKLEVSLRSGNNKEIVKLTDQILQIDPNNGFAIRMRMFNYENNHQIEKAWEFLNSRINQTPHNTMLYFIKIDFISRFTQYTKYAAELAEQIHNNFQKNPRILNSMAWGFLTRFPFEGELLKPTSKCIKRALELTEKDKSNEGLYASCLNTLALLYYRCGMPQEALETQRKVSELALGDKVQNDSGKAETLYSSALEMQKILSGNVKK
jgi:tetratricopeptide (TPR) repeat protein